MREATRPAGIRDYSQQELVDAAYAAAAKNGRINRPDLFVRQIFKESKFGQDRSRV